MGPDGACWVNTKHGVRSLRQVVSGNVNMLSFLRNHGCCDIKTITITRLTSNFHIVDFNKETFYQSNVAERHIISDKTHSQETSWLPHMQAHSNEIYLHESNKYIY